MTVRPGDDLYVLVWNADTGRTPAVIAIAADPEALNMRMADFTAYEQGRMHIENHDLWDGGDR